MTGVHSYYQLFFQPDGFRFEPPLKPAHKETLTANEKFMGQLSLDSEVDLGLFSIPADFKQGNKRARFSHASVLAMQARALLEDIDGVKVLYFPPSEELLAGLG